MSKEKTAQKAAYKFIVQKTGKDFLLLFGYYL